jgi:hypothetical protein
MAVHYLPANGWASEWPCERRGRAALDVEGTVGWNIAAVAALADRAWNG